MILETFSVSTKEQAVLEQLKNKILSYDNSKDFQQLELARFISREMALFTKDLAGSIKKLSASGNVDAIFCQGLPKFNQYDDKHLTAAKCLALSLSYLIGQPFQYIQQNEGQIAAEIKPTEKLKNTQSSGGTIEFGWHTDDCFFSSKVRTHWISLYGFYNPKKTITRLALLNDILKHISEKSLLVLMSKRFQVKLPISIGLAVEEQWTTPISLIRINGEQQYEIGVPTFDTRPVAQHDADAHLALQELIAAADKAQTSICIEDGNAIIFDNNKALHARGEILGNRTIIRTYIRPNLDELRVQTGQNGPLFDAEKLATFKEAVYG